MLPHKQREQTNEDSNNCWNQHFFIPPSCLEEIDSCLVVYRSYRCGTSLFLMGNSSIKGPFPIAMSNHQRVSLPINILIPAGDLPWNSTKSHEHIMKIHENPMSGYCTPNSGFQILPRRFPQVVALEDLTYMAWNTEKLKARLDSADFALEMVKMWRRGWVCGQFLAMMPLASG